MLQGSLKIPINRLAWFNSFYNVVKTIAAQFYSNYNLLLFLSLCRSDLNALNYLLMTSRHAHDTSCGSIVWNGNENTS